MKPIFMSCSAPFGRAIFASGVRCQPAGDAVIGSCGDPDTAGRFTVFVAVPARSEERSRDVVQGQRGIEAEDLLELVDVVDLGAHGDVGDALQDELQDHGDLMLLHQGVRLGEGLLELVRALDPDRLAAQPLGDRDVIDAVALDVGAC